MKQRATQSETAVWSDDFDDKKLDGWTLQGDFTADEGTLKALECPACEGGMNLASHPSSIAYGTWSFDAYVSGALAPRLAVMFIGDFPPDIPPPADQEIHVYMLEILELDKTALNLIKLTGRGENQTPAYLASYRATRDLHGWQHVDITRETAGRFRVHLNRKLVMEAVDVSITTSQSFCFLAPAGKALDNIVVSRAIHIP
jgi:hypothetical protein